MKSVDEEKTFLEDLMIYILLLSFFFISCGSNSMFTDQVFVDNRSFAQHKVDDAFVPYLQEFQDVTGKNDSQVTMIFGVTAVDPTKDVIGYCTFYANRPVIVVNKEWWDSGAEDDDERTLLAFHELGHCILYRDHLNTYIDLDGDHIPESIMNAYISDNLWLAYKKHKDYYLKELKRTTDVPMIH